MLSNDEENRIRLLAVDEEYLIAIDIQNILQEFNMFEVDVETLTTVRNTPVAPDKYDVVIIDPGPKSEARLEIAAAIESSGATLVWSSTELSAPGGTTDCETMPVVSKPFSSRDLLEAIERALSASHPLKARAVAALLSASGP